MNRNLAATARKRLLRRGRELLRRGRAGAIPSDPLGNLAPGERDELEEIHSALERIERGIYGRCDLCYESVELDRLTVAAWERYCEQCESTTTAEERAAELSPPALHSA